jgi:hypothetical protein
MQKIYLLSMQIETPLANGLKSIGYTKTVPFLNTGKYDIYQHKSLGKSATDCVLSFGKPKRVTKLFWDRYLTYKNTVKVHYCLTLSQKKYCIHISFRF